MARVKRGVAAKRRHKKVLEQAKGYYGNKSRSFRAANEQLHAQRAVRLPRPPRPQGRVPAPVDPADQRRRPASTTSATAGSSPGSTRPASRSTARSSPTWPSPTRPRSAPSSTRPRLRSRTSETAARRSRTPRSSDCGASSGAAVRVPRRARSSSRAPCWSREAVAAGWDVEAPVRGARRRPGRRRRPGPRAGDRRRRADRGHRDAARACSPSCAAALAAPAVLGRRRTSSSSPTGSPTPATSARSCARPRRPASTPSCSRRARSTRSTRRSCGRRPGRCSTSRSSPADAGRRRAAAGLRLLGTSSHHGTLAHRRRLDRPARHRRSAARPTACPTTPPVDEWVRIDHAAAPRASTWRWPPPSCASRPPAARR